MIKFVESGDVQIATESFGRAERGTILLIMGATASMVWWPDALIERLVAGGYRVIRFDHRDTGQSTTNAPGDVRYDVDDMAGDVEAILDGFDARSAHLVGLSLGGLLAQIVAQRAPERVLSLTLIAAEPLGIEYGAGEFSPDFMQHFGKMAELDWTDMQAVSDFMLEIARLSAGPGVPFDQVSAIRRIDAELDRTKSMQSAFNHAAIEGEIDPELSASQITQPTLVIHGTDDPLISVKAANRSAEAISGSELLLLDGRGHELIAQDVPEVADAILRLCSTADRA